ncbi:MAG: thioredoxin domain-containing protein [Sulfurimonas sp.]|nr:thioredoxin domain-containing protein [Sulfurimonas sp.]
MSLMLKLLTIILLLSSLVKADAVGKKIENFLEKTYSANPSVKSLIVKMTNKVAVKEKKNWIAYYMEISAVLKDNRKVKQQMVWFSNGEIFSKELFDLKTETPMSDYVAIEFKNEYYKKENLIYGNKNARNKIAIFSDPLCPFCRDFVPKVINEMKKDPSRYAVYYYHLPLSSLHPAAVDLVKAAVALEMKGIKDVVLNLYKVKVNAKEKDTKKILKAFNKVMKSNITIKDINTKAVIKHVKADEKIAEELMVNGTPTMFVNNKLDKSKRKYIEVK